MGGHEYICKCPKCGNNTMECYDESNDPQESYRICWVCGYQLTLEWTEHQMTKQELIERRIECEWEMWKYDEYGERMELECKTPIDFCEWTKRQVFAENL